MVLVLLPKLQKSLYHTLNTSIMSRSVVAHDTIYNLASGITSKVTALAACMFVGNLFMQFMHNWACSLGLMKLFKVRIQCSQFVVTQIF